MNSAHVTFRRACMSDLEAILVLQEKNQLDAGGMLSARLPPSLIAEMIREMPVIVAVSDQRLVGYLLISTPAMNEEVPIVFEMLKVYHADHSTLINGPICVSSHLRGQGIAQGLYQELWRINHGYNYLCFIRRDNDASIRTHLQLGMQEVGTFIFNQAENLIFIYRG